VHQGQGQGIWHDVTCGAEGAALERCRLPCVGDWRQRAALEPQHLQAPLSAGRRAHYGDASTAGYPPGGIPGVRAGARSRTNGDTPAVMLVLQQVAYLVS